MKAEKISGAIAGIVLSMSWAVAAAENHETMEHEHGGMAPAGKEPGESCHLHVHATEEAERQPGGALNLMKPGAPAHQMAGAHMVHKPRHGGAFFMAPDKLHHLEALYSERCGFQVAFYNAFIEPIRADRFRGFIKVVPESEDEPEIMRFLELVEHRSVLAATIGDEASRPFLIELYVAFPESNEPQLFTVNVP